MKLLFYSLSFYWLSWTLSFSLLNPYSTQFSLFFHLFSHKGAAPNALSAQGDSDEECPEEEVYLPGNENEVQALESAFMPPIITPAGPFCFNDPAVNLMATPAGGTWSGTGITNTTLGTFNPMVAGGGTHTISYTQGAETSMIDIIVSPDLVIIGIGGDGTDCAGGSTGGVFISVTGGTFFPGPVACRYRYDWDWDGSPGNDSYPSGCAGGIDMEDLNNLPAGIYTVTVTDFYGCTATGSAEVTQPADNVTPVADDVQLDCFGDAGGTIDLSVTGGTPGYTYDWDTDGTGDNDDPEDVTITGPGPYTVTVTDFLGCTAELTVNVTEPPELTASATSDDVLCFGGTSGEIDLSVSGGTPGFTYDWSIDGTGDNDDPQNPTGVPAGSYTVTVTDANGCTATAMVDVQEPLSEVTASAVGFDVTCFAQDDGDIDLTPGGGTGVFTYDWDNDGTGDNNDTQDLTGVPPGSYSVTVTDANGCTAVTSVTIAEPPELTGVYMENICAGGSTVVNGTVYDDNNTSGTEVFTAANGCDSTVTVTITVDPPLMGDFSHDGCTGDGYSITIGSTTYNEGNPSGMVTIQNADGCDSIVTVTLNFTDEVTGEETYDGCEGDGYSVVVNGTTYDEGNPDGMETLVSAAGCDSVVTVALNFNPETTFEITNDGCEGDGFSVVVNGTTYDQDNPSGMETITNAAGCDSIVTIDLNFGENTTGEETHSACSGSGFSVVVNGTTYNEGNASGTETFTNAAGCDSVVTVMITFLPPTTGMETYTGCTGDGYSVTVNGTVYNEANSSGTETLTGANGCDSVVTIALSFLSGVTGMETYAGCENDGYSVVVNGTTYDESNPSGMQTLTAAGGCDSVVTIDLEFSPETMFDLTHQGCQGDAFSVVVNGTIYDEANPTGQEVISNAAGCDSTVNIMLSFGTNSTGTETHTGCQDDGYSVVVNGNTYNQANPSGTEVMTNAAGCDSTVTINLTFNPPTFGSVSHNGCIGDGFSVIVNGTVYDENNQTGTEVMTGSNGCDSTVLVNLVFSPEITTDLNPTLCSGGSIIVNGTIYDINNPTGTEFMVAQGGCDSVINVALSFNPPGQGFETHDGCTGDGYFVVVNGTIYDALNPSGTESWTTAAGCDTIVDIDLNFDGAIFGTLDTIICAGGEVIINGTIYDQNNTSGEETFVTAEGCDSIVTVTVGFESPLEGFETYSGCFGDGYFVLVNNTIYDEINPEGVEFFSTPEGCDTTVYVNLDFGAASEGFEFYNGCSGDGYSVVVNGNTYNEGNPSGTENIFSPSGCDSVVTIDLVFHQSYEETFTHQGCIGDGYQILVNGTLYSSSNPVGTEEMMTQYGCDSTIHVDLQFTDIIEVDMSPTLCAGGSIVVGGTIYDEDNPTGTETFVAGGGCDSVITINLSFNDPLTGEETYNGCLGDGYSVIVNGTIYDEVNPSGVEEFANQDGCDTIVTINLTYNTAIITSLDTTLCDGESIIINGTTYDASLSSGQETFTTGGSCDSIVVIDISFYPPITGVETYTGCEGDGYSVLVNGTSYSETNPSGTEVLQSVMGCDSTVTIALTFENCCVADTASLTRSICEDDELIFQGVAYDATGVYTIPVADAVGPGCDSVYILDLTVTNNVIGSFPQNICEGESFSFNGSDYSTTGVYDYLIPGGAVQGCDSTARLVLTVNPLPTAEAGEDQEITCDANTVGLQGNAGGGNITWSGPGITASNQNQPNPNVSKPGLYTLTVVSAAGCESTDQVQVTASTDLPIADAGQDMILSCDVLEVQINAQAVGQDLAILWTGPGINSTNQSQLNLMLNTPGMYILSLIDTLSLCEAEPDTVFIEDISNEVLAVVAAPEQITCDNNSVSLNASQSTSGQHIVYTWTNAGGNVLGNSLSLSVTQSGNFTLVVEDTLSGCKASTNVLVAASEDFPAVDAGPDKLLNCNVSEAQLNGGLVMPNINVVLEWTGPAGGILTDPNLPGIDVAEPGWYVLNAVDTINGCASFDSVYVEENIQIPDAEAGTDKLLTCHQEIVELNAGGSSSSDEILHIWNGPSIINDTTFAISVDAAGMYYLLVVDQESGCIELDSVEVDKISAPEGVDLDVQDVACFGTSSGSILFESVEGGLPPYTYTVTGEGYSNTTDDPDFLNLPPGVFEVMISDANDCDWATQVVIEDGIDVDLEIGPNLSIDLGDSLQLNAQLNVPMSVVDSIVWSPANILSCTHCPNPMLIGSTGGTVVATVFVGSCEATDLITVRVKENTNVFIPNVFSPNGDGRNDYFTIFSDGTVDEILELEIYDRWGERVFLREGFTPNDEKLGWDGRMGGQEMQPAVFVYKAKLRYVNNTEEIVAGDFTLVR